MSSVSIESISNWEKNVYVEYYEMKPVTFEN